MTSRSWDRTAMSRLCLDDTSVNHDEMIYECVCRSEAGCFVNKWREGKQKHGKSAMKTEKRVAFELETYPWHSFTNTETGYIFVMNC